MTTPMVDRDTVIKGDRVRIGTRDAMLINNILTKVEDIVRAGLPRPTHVAVHTTELQDFERLVGLEVVHTAMVEPGAAALMVFAEPIHPATLRAVTQPAQPAAGAQLYDSVMQANEAREKRARELVAKNAGEGKENYPALRFLLSEFATFGCTQPFGALETIELTRLLEQETDFEYRCRSLLLDVEDPGPTPIGAPGSLARRAWELGTDLRREAREAKRLSLLVQSLQRTAPLVTEDKERP